MLHVGIVCMAGCLKMKVLIAALNGRAGRQGGGLSERRVRHDNCFNMLVDAHIFTSNLDVI